MLVIGLEGKNVTEAQYLNHFNSLSKKYRIIFGRGNSLNPVGIVEDTINSINNYDFDLDDKAYCLMKQTTENVLEQNLHHILL